MAYSIEGVEGLPEIQQDDDLAELIAAAAELEDGDILVVTSKIVSKSEGRIVQADDREAAITAETVRVVATREHEGGVTRIVENRQGIIGAAAGVDASNAPHGTVLLLPVDPDASARALATGLREVKSKQLVGRCLQLDAFFDGMLRSRISRRVIAEQHLQLAERRSVGG